MHKLNFYIVDVFAETKWTGNQLAVFVDAKFLGKKRMQRIAKEMNFSETTFITSNENRNNGYDVRIFTPERELPFAGHPTLGTAYVIHSEIIKRHVEKIKLNLKIGQIPVSIQFKNHRMDFLWMKPKTPSFGREYDPERWAELLGLERGDFEENYPVCEVSAGSFCFIVPLKTLDAVKRVQVNLHKYYDFIEDTKAKVTLVFAKDTYKKENDLNVRFFAHYLGVPEDPATGSANGCLAAYLVKYNYFGSDRIDVRVEQGHELGRPSLLLLKAEYKGEDIDINVGGRVFMVAKGEFFV